MFYVWIPYIYVRLVFFLILGILARLWFPFLPSGTVSLLFGIGFCIYVLFTFLTPRFPRGSPYAGALAFLLIFLFGWLRSDYIEQKKNEVLSLPVDSVEAFVVSLRDHPKPAKTTLKIPVYVHQLKWKDSWKSVAKFKSILYLKLEDSLTHRRTHREIRYGEKWLISGKLRPLTPPQNPEAFDYRAYLHSQQVYYQAFIREKQFVKIKSRAGSWPEAGVWAIRQYGQASLERFMAKSDQKAVALALLLGVKDDLSGKIKDAYSGAGLMHILAVSGLHVGFLVAFLAFVFGGLRRGKYGKFIYALLITFCLFAYALLTGLSPSVLRAVTMFSFVVWAFAMGRQGSIYNSLAASAFVLLTVYPPFLLSVGFQLSYLALAGIVYLQPRIYRWLSFSWRPMDYVWQICSVSIAAQVATGPLSLYYFHQFPNYFLLSNVVVLPLVPLVLIGGFAYLLLAWVPFIGLGLGWLTNLLLLVVNWISSTISQLPGAVTSDIYLSTLEMILAYVSLVLFLLLFQKRVFAYLILLFISLSVGVGQRIWWQEENRTQKIMVVFHTPGKENFNLINGNVSYLWAHRSQFAPRSSLDFAAKGFWLSRGINQHVFHPPDSSSKQTLTSYAYHQEKGYSIIAWEGYTILRLRERVAKPIWQGFAGLRPDFLLLEEDVLYSLEKAYRHILPGQVIIGSGYSYYRSQKLQNEASKKQIPCYSVLDQGAFVFFPDRQP